MRSTASDEWRNHYPAPDVVHVDLVVRNGKRILHTHDYTEIALHPVHLCRVFKRDMTTTPMSHLRYLRWQHAAHLLVTSTTPVGSIGSAVGWDDANLFSRRFRAICRLTPSAHRAKHGRLRGGRRATPAIARV